MLISQFPGCVYFGSAVQGGPKRLDEYRRHEDPNICRGKDLASWGVDWHPDVVVRSAIDPGYSKGEDDRDEGQCRCCTVRSSGRLDCPAMKM